MSEAMRPRARTRVCAPVCARPPWCMGVDRPCSSFNPKKQGNSQCHRLQGNRWPPWTPGHLRHGRMRRLPRHRATVRGAMSRAPSQPFGPTTANLASGSGCNTARLLCRAERDPLKTTHRLRLRSNSRHPACQMPPLRPAQPVARGQAAPGVASSLAAHIPRRARH